jgi:ankyrin repeat protein
LAAKESCAEIVALVSEKHPNISAKTPKGHSALTLCCYRFDYEAAKVAEVLLRRKAEVNVACGENARPPLMIACFYGRPELVALLLKHGADVNATDAGGASALHFACRNGAFGREIVPVLVNAGANLMHTDKEGKGALFHAFRTGGVMADTISEFLPAEFKSKVFFCCCCCFFCCF